MRKTEYPPFNPDDCLDCGSVHTEWLPDGVDSDGKTVFCIRCKECNALFRRERGQVEYTQVELPF